MDIIYQKIREKHPRNYIPLDLDKYIYQDIGIFQEDGLYKSIDYNLTDFGKSYLKYNLENPVFNPFYYQEKIKYLLDLPLDKKNIIENLLFNLLENQQKILWFWHDKTKEEKKLLKMICFEKNKFINFNHFQPLVIINYITKLYLQPIYYITSPLLTFIIPYIVLRFQFKVNLSFSVYFKLIKTILPITSGLTLGLSKKVSIFTFCTILYIILYIYSFYNIYNDIKNLIEIYYILIDKLLAIKLLLVNTHKISKIMKIKDPPYIQNISSKLKYLFQFNKELFYYGNTIYIYHIFISYHRDLIEYYFIWLGNLEHIYSLSKFYRNISISMYPITFSKFDDNLNNHLFMSNFWNIHLLGENPVLNSLILGDKYKKNLILTGPNAGGKSTILKTLFYNVFLSHLYGFSLSSTYQSSKFDFFFTHLTKSDKINQYSLFQSEILHFDYIFKTIKLLKNKQQVSNVKFFGIMDEMFTSTTPEEGSSCAYAVANKLALLGGINIITTHYKYLVNLEKEEDLDFYNISMEYKNNQFTYQIIKGINCVHLALKLLNNHQETKKVYPKAKEILDKIIINT